MVFGAAERPALIRLLYEQAPMALVISGINALVLVAMAWGVIDTRLLLAWLLALLTTLAHRLVGIHHFRRARPDDSQLEVWATRYARGALLGGLLWGLATIMLIASQDIVLQAFSAFLMGGMAAAAAITNVALLSAYFSFVLPMMLPMPVMFALQADRLHLAMAVLSVLFILLIVRSAQRAHATLRHSVALSLDNSDLLARLKASLSRLQESEALFRTLAETTATGIFAYREHYIYANPAGLAMCGYSLEELRQMPHWQIVHPDDRDMTKVRAKSRLQGQTVPSHYEFRILDKLGRTRWVELHVGVVNLEGEPANLATAFDITDRKVAEASLFLEKELAQITLRAIGDAVVTTDAEGHVETLNPAAEKLLNIHESEARGQGFDDIVSLQETGGEPFADPVMICLAGLGTVRPQEPLLLVSADSPRTVELAATPLLDSDGLALGTVVVFHDVSALHELGREMSYHASHDALTGLVNRREFLLRLGALLEGAQCEGSEHALCYLDLDQFKVVNDSCGHIAGDELLKQVTSVLRHAVREGDTLGRLGGDEFGLLFSYCPMAKAAELAEHLRDLLQDFRFQWEGRVFEIGASMGVVPVRADSGGVNDLLRAADAACYVAKEGGRNRVHVYQPDDLAVAEHQSRLAWVARIREGIKADRFVLYAQRIEPLDGEEAGRHFEVLLRLRAADGSLIAPGVFLPTAERYRLMPELDRWVVHQALGQLAPLLRAGDAQCSLNLSGQSLDNAGMLGLILEEIGRLAIPPASVCIEITETSAISNLTGALEFARGLKAAGCKLALDDFGSGLSSFSYLKQLPVDYLKIDGSFVRDIAHDPIDRAIVQSIVYVARNIGKATIAECVEDAEVLALLRELDVDFGQGYHLQRPRPLSDWLTQ
jgi:diguanylate cyclase (GGDEF)-like protein/PAS domain S-box-containing protein